MWRFEVSDVGSIWQSTANQVGTWQRLAVMDIRGFESLRQKKQMI
jgi:hypothetical protein